LSGIWQRKEKRRRKNSGPRQRSDAKKTRRGRIASNAGLKGTNQGKITVSPSGKIPRREGGIRKFITEYQLC